MGKYEPIRRYLRRHRSDAVELNFAQLEGVLGALLPNAAQSPEWWRNDATSPHASAWRAAGFRAYVDTRSERVLFKRESLIVN